MSDVNKNDSDDSKILIYEVSTEPNEDSKSIILAPYNSLDNSYYSSENEEKGDFKDIEILNDICEFNSQAQKANEIYQKTNNCNFDMGKKIEEEKVGLKEERKEENIKDSREKKEKEKEEEINFLSLMQNLYYLIYNYEYYRQLNEYYYYYYYYYYHF